MKLGRYSVTCSRSLITATSLSKTESGAASRSGVVGVGTRNTNSAWLSRRLMALGVKPVVHLAAPDERKAVIDALRDAAARARAIVVTGGLGPTEDDLTRDAIAEAMGVPLELHEPSLEVVKG